MFEIEISKSNYELYSFSSMGTSHNETSRTSSTVQRLYYIIQCNHEGNIISFDLLLYSGIERKTHIVIL